VLLEDPFSRLFSIFCVLCGSLRGMNSGTGSRSVFPWILDDFGELLGGFLDHFSGRSAKTKKCIWTAQACTDCISSFPKNTRLGNFFQPFFRTPVREAMLPGFWCFGDSLGAPGVTILEARGHFWADRKRGRKKEGARERNSAPEGTKLGTARGRRGEI